MTVTYYSKLKKAVEAGKTIVFGKDKQFDAKIVKEYLAPDSYDEFLKHMTTSEPRHYYEVFLEGRKCNFAMDLDIEDDEGRADPE